VPEGERSARPPHRSESHPTPLFEIHITTPAPGVWLVELRGEQDVAASEELHNRLHAVAESAGDVIVDLTGTTFIDSVAFSEIITARRAVERAGRRFALVAPAAHAVTAILDVADADRRIFTTYETQDAAIRVLTASE
jgi:anti-sigma B factor antagonist